MTTPASAFAGQETAPWPPAAHNMTSSFSANLGMMTQRSSYMHVRGCQHLCQACGLHTLQPDCPSDNRKLRALQRMPTEHIACIQLKCPHADSEHGHNSNAQADRNAMSAGLL